MNKTQTHILNELKAYFKQYDDIKFALIFGSFSSGKVGGKSDLDVGIFCNENLDLLILGRMIVDLEKITEMEIDLLELNGLYKKNPFLAYQIVTNYKLLFSIDEDAFVEFKRKSLLSYFDTERLRKPVNSAFYKRISSKKFGKRNYA